MIKRRDFVLFGKKHGVILGINLIQNNMDIKEASAGTLESGDILVRIAPADSSGLKINLESSVAYQFGDQIKAVITDTLKDMGIEDAIVYATDKGALDCTIKARVTAAATRSHWSFGGLVV